MPCAFLPSSTVHKRQGARGSVAMAASRVFKFQLRNVTGATVLDANCEASVTPQGVVLSGGPASTQLSPLTWNKLLRVRPRLQQLALRRGSSKYLPGAFLPPDRAQRRCARFQHAHTHCHT